MIRSEYDSEQSQVRINTLDLLGKHTRGKGKKGKI